MQTNKNKDRLRFVQDRFLLAEYKAGLDVQLYVNWKTSTVPEKL